MTSERETRIAATRTATGKRGWGSCSCSRRAAESQEHRAPKHQAQRAAANCGAGARPWPPEPGDGRGTSHETPRLESQSSERRYSKRGTHGTRAPHPQGPETKSQARTGFRACGVLSGPCRLFSGSRNPAVLPQSRGPAHKARMHNKLSRLVDFVIGAYMGNYIAIFEGRPNFWT